MTSLHFVIEHKYITIIINQQYFVNVKNKNFVKTYFRFYI